MPSRSCLPAQGRRDPRNAWAPCTARPQHQAGLVPQASPWPGSLPPAPPRSARRAFGPARDGEKPGTRSWPPQPRRPAAPQPRHPAGPAAGSSTRLHLATALEGRPPSGDCRSRWRRCPRPASPEHVLGAPDLHRLGPPAPRGPDSALQLLCPGAAGAARSRHRLRCHVARLPEPPKIGMQIRRRRVVPSYPSCCGEAGGPRSRGPRTPGDQPVLTGVEQILPKSFPTSRDSIVGERMWKTKSQPQKTLSTRVEESRSPVAHACNPSYSEGREEKDCGSKPAQANSWRDPIAKNPSQK
jgi:hypothetical protein